MFINLSKFALISCSGYRVLSKGSLISFVCPFFKLLSVVQLGHFTLKLSTYGSACVARSKRF